MFGTKHLILLAMSIVLVVGLFILSRKFKLKTICNILFYTGIVAEIIKLFYFTITNEDKLGGVLPKTDLPFHLCSIQIVFIIIIKFCNNEKVKRFLFNFMMPSCLFGGLAAILIPTSSSLGGYWIITLEYFGYHAALIIFSLHLFTSKEFKPTIKDYFNCLKFVLILMFFAIYINSILYDGNSDINFMYVVSPPQEGLPYLNENQGWFAYIIKYAILIFVCITACYIKPIISSLKSKIKLKSEVLISEKTEATTKDQKENK